MCRSDLHPHSSGVSCEFAGPAEGWAHTVSFSPPGDAPAFVSEPILFLSIRTVLNILPEVTATPSIYCIFLVWTSGSYHQDDRASSCHPIWTSEDFTVATGHDCQPYVFYGNESRSLDDTTAPKSASTPSRFGPVGPGRSNSAVLNTSGIADPGVSRAPVV